MSSDKNRNNIIKLLAVAAGAAALVAIFWYRKQVIPLYWIPLLPLLGAAVNILVGRKLSRLTVHLVGCGTVLASCAIVVSNTFKFLYPLWAKHGPEVPRLSEQVFTWISAGTVDIKIGLWLDPLSAVMTLVITFIGFLIHLYSTGYMSHEKDYARFFGYLNLFTGSMLLLVLGDNLLLLFVGWEGVGLCSYLLIGFWYGKTGTDQPGDANATAGRKAFLVNRVGDFAFILGMFVLFYFTGTLNIEKLAGSIGLLTQTWNAFGITTVTVAGAAAILLLIGATGKSAQIPLFVWLPDAMAGPTPVSALIHAATMVTAGVYMVARLNFVYMLSPTAMGVVALVGVATALFAATIGIAQNDIKKVLAYSTISQLGYMFLAVGVGAFSAGVFHLFTHAFFKACLFLCAGSVIHAMSGKQDITEMGGLDKKTPITHMTFLISTLAIAGIIPFSGFFSKDEILWKAISTANPTWPNWFPILLYILALLAALCTAFYMFRLYFLTFKGECRADEETKHHIHESPWNMTAPLVVLAAGAAVLGFLGLPGVMGSNWFHHWLAPVVDRGKTLVAQMPAAVKNVAVQENHLAHSHTTEWGLMALSLGTAIIGILIARRLYRDGFSEKVKQVAAGMPRLHKVLRGKYFVDEIYHGLIVHPLKWSCRVLADAFDAFFIDFVLITGAAKIVDWCGQALRSLHTGNVQRYVVALLAGAAVIIYFLGGNDARFDMQPGKTVRVGQVVSFEARLKSSDVRKVEYQWDFDGDGKWDTAWQGTPGASHRYDAQRKFKVRLQVRDTRWKQRVDTDTRVLTVVKQLPGDVVKPGPERAAADKQEVR